MKECKDQFAWNYYLLLLVEKHSKFGDQHLGHLVGMKLHIPFLLSTKNISCQTRSNKFKSGQISHRNNSYATSGPLVFEPNFHCIVNMRYWHSKFFPLRYR